jgi:hypothetical protein
LLLGAVVGRVDVVVGVLGVWGVLVPARAVVVAEAEDHRVEAAQGAAEEAAADVGEEEGVVRMRKRGVVMVNVVLIRE